MSEDQTQVLYYLNKTIEEQTSRIKEIHDDIHDIKVDVAVMKSEREMIPRSSRKKRVADATAGGSVGAILVSMAMGLIEYFKSN